MKKQLTQKMKQKICGIFRLWRKTTCHRRTASILSARVDGCVRCIRLQLPRSVIETRAMRRAKRFQAVGGASRPEIGSYAKARRGCERATLDFTGYRAESSGNPAVRATVNRDFNAALLPCATLGCGTRGGGTRRCPRLA